MLKEFNRLANLWNWNLNRCETLLAVSGGADSVVMAHFFKHMNLPFSIAHVNYGLRGKESDLDEQLVQELANALGVECFIHRINPQELSVSQGISLQMAARTVRYSFFREIQAKYPGRFAKIATAHHANDNLEHFFLYLYRGNLPVAWRGIPAENGDIIRPLLGYTKHEIYEIATEQGWEWREDLSNQKTLYLRNKIRHWIIPLLMAPHENSTSQLSKGEFRNREGFEHQFYELSLQYQRIQAHRLPQLELEWDRWVEQTEHSVWIPETVGGKSWLLETELRNYAQGRLQRLGFSLDQCQKILKGTVGVGGKILGKQHTAHRARKGWMLFKVSSAAGQESMGLTPNSVSGKLKVTSVSVEEFRAWSSENKIHPSATTVFVSRDTPVSLLQVGSRVQGDFFLSKSGKKVLLSDVMIDYKIENYLKDRYPVITQGMGEIVAVLGLKLSDVYRVKPQDVHCFRIDFIQN